MSFSFLFPADEGSIYSNHFFIWKNSMHHWTEKAEGLPFYHPLHTLVFGIQLGSCNCPTPSPIIHQVFRVPCDLYPKSPCYWLSQVGTSCQFKHVHLESLRGYIEFEILNSMFSWHWTPCWVLQQCLSPVCPGNEQHAPSSYILINLQLKRLIPHCPCNLAPRLLLVSKHYTLV